jgi:hypothetical protein
MPGIGELIDGAVQQAPQPLRQKKASDCIPHYKPGWANSAPAVKVGGTGEVRMESASDHSNLVAPGAGVVFPQADGAVRASTNGSPRLPKAVWTVRCAARRCLPMDALTIFREEPRRIRNSLVGVTMAAA